MKNASTIICVLFFCVSVRSAEIPGRQSDITSVYKMIDDEFKSEELRSIIKYKVKTIHDSNDILKARSAVVFLLDLKCDFLSAWVAVQKPGETKLYLDKNGITPGDSYFLAMAAIKFSFPRDFSKFIPQAWESIHFIKQLMRSLGYDDEEINRLGYNPDLAYTDSVVAKIISVVNDSSKNKRSEDEEADYQIAIIKILRIDEISVANKSK